MTWIGTRSGLKLDFANPTVAMIDASDIAYALSRIPRFAGHTVDTISVAQHSVMVCDACDEYPLEALLHDAPEAYMMDCPRPLKLMLGDTWREIEDRLYGVIAKRFGAVPFIPAEVKAIDDAILFAERNQQQPVRQPWGWEVEPLLCSVVPWGEEAARYAFLNRLAQYGRVGYQA